jgi:hypothetical protein
MGRRAGDAVPAPTSGTETDQRWLAFTARPGCGHAGCSTTLAMKAWRSLCAAAVLAGCATQQGWVYEHPSASVQQRRQDEAICLHASIGRAQDRLGVLETVPIDREAYNECMVARGYTVVPAPGG